jgi:dephospho-CoA kinase
MAGQPSVQPFRVGLTGGIASGKSTVADILAELGAQVIDTDIIAREVVEPGQPALDEIRAAFGDDVFHDDDTLDRRALRTRIFADPEERQRLEGILHPRIREATMTEATRLDGTYQVIVVPLLAGSPLAEEMDRILVVDCAEETQISRLLDRDAETEAQARRILSAQASRSERLAIADDIILNDGSLADLEAATVRIHERYAELAGTRA